MPRSDALNPADRDRLLRRVSRINRGGAVAAAVAVVGLGAVAAISSPRDVGRVLRDGRADVQRRERNPGRDLREQWGSVSHHGSGRYGHPEARNSDRETEGDASPGADKEWRFVTVESGADARWTALGTSVHVIVDDERGLEAATAAVRRVLDDVDATYSRFRDDSELAEPQSPARARPSESHRCSSRRSTARSGRRG